MNKKRVEIARTTLVAIDQGKYEVNGTVININEAVQNAIAESTLYSPKRVHHTRDTFKGTNEYTTRVEVMNCTTLEAAQSIGGHIGVLNFASAKNPGGGFIRGAQSQEESIARSSSLYPAIDQHTEMYSHNRAHKTYLYSDYMIYTPNVVVFKNDDGDWLEKPYLIDVLTSPAANVGAILSNKPEEMDDVERTMIQRIDAMFAVFASRNVKQLVLGAWGCGVFRNDPEKIAAYFHDYLKAGGKYEGVFERIVFAVLDRKDRGIYRAFEKLRMND